MFLINKNIFEFHVKEQRKTEQNKQQRPQWENVTYLFIYLGFILSLILRKI